MATSRRALAVSAAVALSAAFAVVPSGAASAAARYPLPAPTGPYEAGESVLHLTDTGRPDPWNPSLGDRQLTVSLFYPARWGTGQPAPYMSPDEAAAFVAHEVPPGSGVTAASIMAIQTDAFTGAKPAPGKFPLVVLSPGMGAHRATLTSLGTDLASRGYVVALVGHPGEDSGEQLADGSLSPCLTCYPTPPAPSRVPADRGIDVKFVVDQLVDGHVRGLSHLVDRHAVGMAGHSIGGASAPSAMEDDPRIRAGVNMDGTFYPAVPAGALGDRAFLMLGRQSAHAPGGDPSWDATWPDLGGYRRWLTVGGMSHLGFSDGTLLAKELGVTLPGEQQTLDPARGIQIERAYVAAFFDKTLKGWPEPLLDGASPEYPEVAFQP